MLILEDVTAEEKEYLICSPDNCNPDYDSPSCNPDFSSCSPDYSSCSPDY